MDNLFELCLQSKQSCPFWARIDGLFFILDNLFDLAPLGKARLLACLLSKQAVLLAHQASHLFP
jgi:hypothetical protein